MSAEDFQGRATSTIVVLTRVFVCPWPRNTSLLLFAVCSTVHRASKIVQKLSYLDAYGNHLINLWVWEVVAASRVPCCKVEGQHQQLLFWHVYLYAHDLGTRPCCSQCAAQCTEPVKLFKNSHIWMPITVRDLITIQHKIIILGVTTAYYLSFLNF